ncbi:MULTISPECIES: hypothetical protein [unclassified Variovorax]|uniref:hypothetical protein n=1 Tax=unclassified Variovorax TaxID=663243 RepID=UPI003F47CB3C
MEKLGETIASALEAFWASQTLDVGGTETVDDLVAAMDSFTATDVLGDIEPIVGMDLPSGEVIRRGGYDSKDQFVTVLTQKILDYVAEHQK